MDGSVKLWEMRNPSNGSMYIIEKIFEYPLYGDIPEHKLLESPSCHIQSLQFRFNKIIAGTRSGDIYFLTLPAASEMKSATTESRSFIMKVYSAHDHEIPKDIDFDSSCQRVFCITERGLFSSYSFKTLELLYQKAFGRSATGMIVLKSRLYIIIAFDRELIVLNVENLANAEPIPSFSITDFTLVTSDVKLSYDEKMLALAMAPSEDKNTEIYLYYIDYENLRFNKFKTIDTTISSILFMDFSSDNIYLMFMDNIGKKQFLDLKEGQELNKIDLQNTEWISEGLKISDKRRGLDPNYTEENNVTCLVRAGHKSIIAADQIGTIRIFEYPCLNTGYYRIYSQHLSFIRLLRVSKSGEYLLSSSSIDKSIFVWRITRDKDKVDGDDNLITLAKSSMDDF